MHCGVQKNGRLPHKRSPKNRGTHGNPKRPTGLPWLVSSNFSGESPMAGPKMATDQTGLAGHCLSKDLWFWQMGSWTIKALTLWERPLWGHKMVMSLMESYIVLQSCRDNDHSTWFSDWPKPACMPQQLTHQTTFWILGTYMTWQPQQAPAAITSFFCYVDYVMGTTRCRKALNR